MKSIIYIFLLSFFFITCGNSSTQESSKEETKPIKEKPSKTSSNQNTQETGYFVMSLNGETFKSTNFANDYCNMHYYYDGEKSVLTIRLKDMNVENSVLISIRGSEALIDNPPSKITNILPKSKEKPAVSINYIKDNDYMATTLGEGEFILEEISKGKIVGSFKGTGGKIKDILTGGTLVPFEGEFSLTTDIIQEVRANE
jgi:hypothetical protein